MSSASWYLGWWAPLPPAVEPDELIEPTVHGPLLAAAGSGAPLDRLGQARLDLLKAAGLATPEGRPRFPVATAEHARGLRAASEDLGGAIARLLAGEWSRIEVEYEPVHATVAGSGEPTIAFLVVGGLVLDVGVRRLLRLQGTAAPPFGSAFAWLAEGETRAVAGAWSARVTMVPGRGHLVRFGRPDAPQWELAGVDPEAAPALPAGREPALRALVEGIGWSVVKLVEDTVPGLDPLRRRIVGAEDEGAFLAWAYALAIDAALESLSARGLLAPPIDGVVCIRVADPALAGM
ncbi:MAG TPA: hypothetical protein VFA46_14440 [Actinomycetes bacterium]|jgi:hypothetical protein|nr:hypothetical protein [Actinomycetes bacterium]